MNIRSKLPIGGNSSIQSTAESRSSHLWLPLMFVVLYGSGFVGAKYGLPYCPPLTFLVLRFTISAALIVALAMLVRVQWPGSLKEVFHIAIAGSLTVGMFSAGVFVAISVGLSPAAYFTERDRSFHANVTK